MFIVKVVVDPRADEDKEGLVTIETSNSSNPRSSSKLAT